MVSIVPTEQKHLKAIAALYQDSFQPLIQILCHTPQVAPELFHDLYVLVYHLHPQGFYSAIIDDKVIGYIVIIDNFTRFQRKLWLQPNAWKMAFKWVTRQYPGVGIRWCFPTIKIALEYLTHQQSTPIIKPYSQIFSIAVAHDFRGKGIGRQLMSNGIQYWKQQDDRFLCLEVDSSNQVAIQLYQSLGFTMVGELISPRGPALIMLKSK